MSDANDKQVGGDHYRSEFQHWDFVELNGIGYLEGNATKYATRWRNKNGRQDIEKALHYVDKLIELQRAGKRGPRGHASIGDCARFSEANDLSPTEDTIVLYLARWRTTDDLRQAKLAIMRLLAECDCMEVAAANDDEPQPCGEVFAAPEDKTGMDQPRGFDEDEDVD